MKHWKYDEIDNPARRLDALVERVRDAWTPDEVLQARDKKGV